MHKGGTFAICLDNRKASYGVKTVFLSIDLRLNWGNPSPEELEMINNINNEMRSPHDEELVQHTLDNLDALAVSQSHLLV